MNYVDIDYHRQYSHLTVMDREGQTIRAGRVPNVRLEIEKFLEGLEPVRRSSRRDARATRRWMSWRRWGRRWKPISGALGAPDGFVDMRCAPQAVLDSV
jgi:hypothetical protein